LTARAINIGLATRPHFSDERAANPADPVPTPIAHQAGPGRCRIDIHLQGGEEAVFIDI